MKQYLFATLFCTVLVFSWQRLYGMFGFQLFEEPPPAYYLNNEIEKIILAPNKWMYRVSWLDSTAGRGLSYPFTTVYEFRDRKFTELEKPVRLFLGIYKEHLRKLNSIRILRPFLYEFPLTPATCSLSIQFRDSNGKFYKPPVISHVYADTTSLSCSYFEEKNPPGKGHVDIYNKPLLEIDELKILYQQGVKRSTCEPHPKVPVLKQYKWMLFKWMSVFCHDHNLVPLTIGPVGNSICDDRPFQCLLMGRQQLTLNEAHQLGASCFKDCFRFVENDKEACEYLQKRSTWGYEKNPSSTPIPEHIAFRITFWDENVDRHVQPYIAEIRYLDGVFEYFTADEVQKLVLVHRETVDEAMKFLEQTKQRD
jgi:hypothetical protein